MRRFVISTWQLVGEMLENKVAMLLFIILLMARIDGKFQLDHSG